MLAMLLQNFNFSLDDPDYTLKYRQTLTMKPRDFKVRAPIVTLMIRNGEIDSYPLKLTADTTDL